MELLPGLLIGFLLGIFGEGLVKPIQAYLFRQGWKIVGKKLNQEAAQSIAKLDETLVDKLLPYYDLIDSIVGGQEEVRQEYNLGILLDKLKASKQGKSI